MKTQHIDDFIAPACFEQIEILFQDEHILVINKPSGLLSLSGKNPRNKDSVHFRLVQQYPMVTLAHRLDLGTSGVMLLAFNKNINANLTKQFQARTVTKRYESILNGHLLEDEGQIEIPIAKDNDNFPRMVVCHEQGKVAVSHFRVIQRLQNPNRTRVIFTPVTGRTHQLRVHSHAIRHPILGCDLYGTARTEAMADRLLLHATDIEFEHPHSQQRMTGSSRCPF